MRFSDRAFSQSFYTGTGTSSEVPGLYPAALDGHPYVLDFGDGTINKHISIELLKPQQQTSGKLGEASINPEGLWPVSVETWHKGAGQTNYDLADSDPARFRTSKGVNPWEPWKLSLLPDTDQKRASTNTNLALQPAGARLYVIDGNEIRYTTDVTVDTPTWTNVTGAPADNPTSITSDGYHVYTAHGASRVYRTDTGTGATAVLVNSGGNVSLVRYLKGRLMAAEGASIYNITSTVAAALPTALFTHANTAFSWVDFAEGRNVIYAAGYAGDKSLIYRITVKADATALDAPIVAGELPDGEIVRCITGYLGFLLIGTDQGVRFATQDANGDLTIGALINLGVSVRCFEGQGPYVWFGWTNYDDTSTGVGRLSLETLNGSAPAYASDLMVTAQGTVTSVCTFQGIRVLTVSASGVWAEDTDLVEEGWLDQGLTSFGIPTSKVALEADIRHEPLAGSVDLYCSLDSAPTFNLIGNTLTAGTSGNVIPIGQLVAEKFELRTVLNRDGDDATDGPTVTRLRLSVNPKADTPYRIIATFKLYTVDDINGVNRSRDPRAERAFIKALRASGRVVIYQELHESFSVVVENDEWIGARVASDGSCIEGLCAVYMKVV